MFLPGGTGNRYDEPDYIYWMYLVISEFYEDYPAIDPLLYLFTNFGKKVSNRANVITPERGAFGCTRDEVLSRPWDSRTQNELEDVRIPALLVIEKPFKQFTPVSDRFAVLRLTEAFGEVEQYATLFSRLALEINAGHDLFNWLQTSARKQLPGKLLRRLSESVEIKPGAFGLSIDVKRLLIGKA